MHWTHLKHELRYNADSVATLLYFVVATGVLMALGYALPVAVVFAFGVLLLAVLSLPLWMPPVVALWLVLRWVWLRLRCGDAGT